MPLRPLESMTNPPDLFGNCLLSHPDSRWWVFQTRPRSEKAFATVMARRGGTYFLPLITRKWRKNGRWFKSQNPLFANYVFVPGPFEVRDLAFGTGLVVRDVKSENQDQLGRQLAGVHAVLTGGDDPRHETELIDGNRVVIVDGPYAGVEGVYLNRGDGVRVLVEVSLLGQGVSVAIDRWSVRPKNAPAPSR
jgi:transcriptional antiterminator RfaH